MIRVLQVLGGLKRGGAETFIMNLYRHIDKDKVQFDFVIHSDQDTDFKKEIINMGGNIYVFPSIGIKNATRLLKMWDKFISEHKEYTIIHSHIRSYASLIFHIAKKHNRIVIAHSHSISNGNGISSKIKAILQLPIRYQADYLFACTNDAGKWLYGEKVIKKENFYVVKNGIDVKRFVYNEDIRREYRKLLGIEDKYVYINVANFRKVKNQEFLIRLIDLYRDTNPDIYLLLVGNGSEKSHCENLVAQLHLENQVSFLGEKNDVAPLLQASDCFLFPSLWEGLGISAIEAQASGLPTICSDKVPNETKVTNLCRFVPLIPEKWIETLQNTHFERFDTSKELIESGYDINAIARWITELYLEMYKRRWKK